MLFKTILFSLPTYHKNFCFWIITRSTIIFSSSITILKLYKICYYGSIPGGHMEHDFSKTICKVRRGLPGGLISSETTDEPGVSFQFNLPPETSYKFLEIIVHLRKLLISTFSHSFFINFVNSQNTCTQKSV